MKHKKFKKSTKIISVILSLLLIIGTIVAVAVFNTASAETFTDDNGISWTVTESYPGWAIAPTDKSQMIGDIEIPATYNGKVITAIDENAFNFCNNLSSISIPDTITSIGSYAFCGTMFTNIDLPQHLNSIGISALSCTNLTSVTIPDSVISIGDAAFEGCSNLTSVTIPDSVTYIGERAFASCSNLTSVTIPDSVTSVSNSTFNCSALTSVTIPDSVTYIGAGAFSSTNLASVTIPGSVTSIGENAFTNCSNLTSVTIPDSVTSVSDSTFEWCSNLTSVTIPDSVISIGNNSFCNCSALTSVTIPDSVTYIGDYAFYGCSSLSLTSIPESVTYIGERAITGVASKDSRIIINTVFEQNGVRWKVEGTNSGLSISAEDDSTITGSVVIPASYEGIAITKIADYALDVCTNLTSVTIPDSVISIGDDAFEGCLNLTSVTIPDSVISIGNAAFGNTYKLTSVTIPGSVTSIGENAFNSSGLNSIIFSSSNKPLSIGDTAFYQCKDLTSINLPKSRKTYVKYRAFYNCTSVESITIPDSVLYIADEAFGKIGIIDTLEIDTQKLSKINCLSFYNDHINNYIIGENLRTIDTPLLSSNPELSTLTLSPQIEITNDYAFYGDDNLTVNTYKAARNVRSYTAAKSIPTVLLDSIEGRKVNFEVTCDKSGYEFEVFKVADIQDNSDWYEIRYNSLIPSITDEIFDGNSAEMLKELDKVSYANLGTPVGSYKTDVDGASKEFNNLDPGIYYVRATNFPANVKWVQNSVFALPYYDKTNGWVYEIDPIPLATKTDESEPEIKKTISNSTRDEDKGRFTDVSLGDTVNFTIKSSTVGSVNTVDSLDFKLKKYEIKDTMSEGLTLNSDSFVVTIEDINGDTTGNLTRDRDYTVNIKTVGTDTVITISLAANYLNNSTDFYSAYNVVTSYTADLNEKAVRGVVGNPNEATSLTWQNKNEVESTVDGNEVYAYTFGIEVNKYNDAGTPLAGSTFALYRTEDDAENQRNAIATGTSTSTGKVEFKTNNNVIRLESGTYYIVETESTQDYNRYTDVITAPLRVEYTDVKANGTYVLSAPENGILQIDVKNSKVIIPNTGGDGAMYRYIIGGIFLLLAAAFIIMKVKSNKKAKAASK